MVQSATPRAACLGISDIMKRLNKNMHGDDPEYYRLPENPKLAAQYFLLYELSLPFGRDLNNRINLSKSATRMVVTLSDPTTREEKELASRGYEWLRANMPELASEATGISVVFSHLTNRLVSSMLGGTLTAMAVVSLILILIFRSFRFGLISLVPNFIPAALSFGLWGYFFGNIGMASAIFAPIAFGIIVDDTIHFIIKYTNSRKAGKLPSESIQITFRSVGRALFTTTLVFGLGFMVFAASGVVANQVLGLLVGITVIIALLADFLFLPPLLMLLDETKETSKQIRERLRSSTT